MADVARGVLSIGGAVAGGIFFGGIGAAVGFTLGNTVGGLLFGDQRDQNVQQGARLDDLTVTTSTYGRPIAITYGTIRLGANMIWASDIVEREVSSEVTAGGAGKGKGGGKGGATGERKDYEYFGNFAMAFCEGPIAKIRRVWANNELIVDLSDTSAGSGFYDVPQSHFRFYLGTEDQLPDPLIEQFEGVGNVPAHRGLAYMVFDDLPLEKYGRHIPKIDVEVVSDAPVANERDSFPGTAMRRRHRFDIGGATGVSINDTGSFRKYHRQSGDVLISVNTGDLVDFAAELVNQGRSSDIADDGLDAWQDPINGDIYTGHEGTTGQGGGFAIHDKNMMFLQYFHFGTFGGVKFGFTIPMGLFRYVFTVTGLGSTGGPTLNVQRWDPSPDPLSTRGVLSTSLQSVSAGGTNVWKDYAFDPGGLPEAGRTWVIGQDGASKIWLVGIDQAGSIGTPVNLSDDKGLGTSTLGGVVYDLVTDSLIVIQSAKITRIDAVTFDAIVVQTNFGGYTGTGLDLSLYRNQPVISGELNIISTSAGLFRRIKTSDLTTIFSVLDTDHTGAANWSIHPAYDPLTQALFTAEGGFLNRYFFDRFGSNPVTLASIVTDLCRRVGLGATSIDVTALTDLVKGYRITNSTTARGAIETLMRVYFFDGAEIDHKVKFKKRDGIVTDTIPSDELAANIEGQESPASIIESRRQEVEVPRRVSLSVLDFSNDYQLATYIDQRAIADPNRALNPDLPGITLSTEDRSVDVPIVLDAQEGRDIVARMIRSAWVERTTLQFNLPPKWLRLDPTDIVAVEKRIGALSSDFRVRITQVNMGEGGVLEVQSILQESALFTPNVSGVGGLGLSPAKLIGLLTATEFFLLNLPSLRGAVDEQGGAWFAAGPEFDLPQLRWRGAALFRALSLDGAFSQAGVTLTKARFGVVQTAFAANNRFTVREFGTTMNIKFVTSDLPTTISDLSFFGGANLMYLVETGEIIQFRDVTIISGREVQVSTFLRGRLGTEGRIAPVPAFSTAVLIEVSRMESFGTSDDRGLDRFYKTVTLGTSVEDVIENRKFVNVSESLKPYPPAMQEGDGEFEPGSGDIILKWNRRTRYNGEWLDLVNVPLNEGFEKYEVDILDAPGGIILRTLAVTDAQTVTYDDADILTDFGVTGDNLTTLAVEVYQLSERVGRGNKRAVNLLLKG